MTLWEGKCLSVRLQIENTALSQGALEGNSGYCRSRALYVTGSPHTVWPEATKWGYEPSSFRYFQEKLDNLIFTQKLKIFKLQFLTQLLWIIFASIDFLQSKS